MEKYMKPSFVLTVDVEADDAWNHPDSISLTNMKQIPRFQALCEAYGIKPTYLLAYECVTRDEALSVLKPIHDRGMCEIGHHLHVWTTPPFEREHPAGIDTAWLRAYQSELPDGLFTEKAVCLKEAITSAFGVAPTAHRAGRWGIDQRTITWLGENGFLVDTSVVPLTDWRNCVGKHVGGPCFYEQPLQPYLWCSGDGYVTEVPVSIDVYPKAWLRMLVWLMQNGSAGTSFVDKIYRICGGGRMLRPDPRYEDGYYLGFFDRLLALGSPVINMMLHSSELAVGGSPFSQNEQDCTRVWDAIETVFRYVKGSDITPCVVSDIAVRA